MASSYEYDIERLRSIEGGEFVDQLTDYQLTKKVYVLEFAVSHLLECL
jgi:hypothetical protein